MRRSGVYRRIYCMRFYREHEGTGDTFGPGGELSPSRWCFKV